MADDYKLKGKYELPGENPQERLNNILSPFFTLVDIVNLEQFSVFTSDKDKRLYEISKNCAKTCLENKQLIRDYLHDISIFYQNNSDKKEK